MRKMMAVLLAVLMLLCVCSCAGNGEKEKMPEKAYLLDEITFSFNSDGKTETQVTRYKYESVTGKSNGLIEAVGTAEESDGDVIHIQDIYTWNNIPILRNEFSCGNVKTVYMDEFMSLGDVLKYDYTLDRMDGDRLYFDNGNVGELLEVDENGRLADVKFLTKDGKVYLTRACNEQGQITSWIQYDENGEVFAEIKYSYAEQDVTPAK